MSYGGADTYVGPQNKYFYLSSMGVDQVYFNELTANPLVPTGKHDLYVKTDGNLYYDGAVVSIGGGGGTSTGITNYDVTTATLTNVQAPLDFVAGTITASPAIINLVGTQDFAAAADGTYTFNFLFNLTEASSPDTVDMEPNLIVTAFTAGSGNFIVGEFLQRLVAHGVSAGASNRRLSLECTIYLKTNEFINIQGQSLGGTNIAITNGSVYISRF